MSAREKFELSEIRSATADLRSIAEISVALTFISFLLALVAMSLRFGAAGLKPWEILNASDVLLSYLEIVAYLLRLALFAGLPFALIGMLFRIVERDLLKKNYFPTFFSVTINVVAIAFLILTGSMILTYFFEFRSLRAEVDSIGMIVVVLTGLCSTLLVWKAWGNLTTFVRTISSLAVCSIVYLSISIGANENSDLVIRNWQNEPEFRGCSDHKVLWVGTESVVVTCRSRVGDIQMILRRSEVVLANKIMKLIEDEDRLRTRHRNSAD